jgi:hypothetical protein
MISYGVALNIAFKILGTQNPNYKYIYYALIFIITYLIGYKIGVKPGFIYKFRPDKSYKKNNSVDFWSGMAVILSGMLSFVVFLLIFIFL